ncbi:MAG: hypothetical protein D6752_06660 [Candidatus Nitrosothermus koennekii]|nr:MAG: hypothetical protein D6752_06660 [Candidatus Nitrosothermus koennekii]
MSGLILDDLEIRMAVLAAKELERRKREEGIKYYEPYVNRTTGESIQKKAQNSKARIILVEGSNRSGKTVLGATTTVFHATGEYPDWWEGRRFEPPIRIRILGTDFKEHLGQVIVPEIMRWMPKRCIERTKKNQTGVIVSIILKNGTQISLMSSEQDLKSFEGWSGHFIWMDEPQPRDKYIASARGLMDFDGVTMMTLTPLDCAWIYDEIKSKAMESDDIECFTLSIMENPYIKEEAIEVFKNRLKENEIEARLYGRYEHLTGLVYKSFYPPVHVIEPIEIRKEWNGYCIMDPHDRLPNAILWAAVDETDDVIFYDYSWIDRLTIKETAEEIKRKESEYDIKIIKRYIDPNFGRKIYGNTGKTVKDEYRRHGLIFHDSIDDLAAGHAAVREYLHFDRSKPISFENHPKVYFFKTLKEPIYQMMHYMYKDDRNKTGTREQVQEQNKHFPDCVRYLLVQRPKYRKPDYDIIKNYEERLAITGKEAITSGYYK